jgi:hypothetical protein
MNKSEQVTMADLLSHNPLFDRWLDKIPAKTNTIVEKKWRLMVLRDGRWSYRDFKVYRKGLDILREHLHEWDDCTLMSKAIMYRPPVVKRGGVREYLSIGVPGQHSDHSWCSLCRRPTLMALFSKHHAVGICVPWEYRCTICGHRRDTLPRWH